MICGCLPRYFPDLDSLEKSAAWTAPQNTLMMQGFEWHVPADQKHWKRLQDALPNLKDAGVDNIWIPPGCKGMDPAGTGYDLYDLYDLGEFDQKGARSTRWGSKEELKGLMQAAQSTGIGIYWDTVLNHKAGADFPETCEAVKVDAEGMSLFTWEKSRRKLTNNRQEPRDSCSPDHCWLGRI